MYEYTIVREVCVGLHAWVSQGAYALEMGCVSLNVQDQSERGRACGGSDCTVGHQGFTNEPVHLESRCFFLPQAEGL